MSLTPWGPKTIIRCQLEVVLKSMCYIILFFQARKLNTENEITMAESELEPMFFNSHFSSISSMPHCFLT